MGVPHTKPAEWPEIAPARFASLISRDAEPPASARVALIGVPDDLGVRLNRGRVGARSGPAFFRAALARFGCDWDAVHERPIGPVVWDAGDVAVDAPEEPPANPAQHLDHTHQRVTDAALELHRAGLVVVAVGGGHDLTFPLVRALARHHAAAVGGVSIDPHLDVRDTPGSGMGFRALIDGAYLDPARFAVLGAGRFAGTQAHHEWLVSRGGAIIPADQLHKDPVAALAAALRRAGDTRFVSFDLDAIDAAFAPGVSALNPSGLSPREASAIARAAGADPRVRHFDLMELCPPHDEQDRTARLAAFLFLSFLTGLAGRIA